MTNTSVPVCALRFDCLAKTKTYMVVVSKPRFIPPFLGGPKPSSICYLTFW